MQIRRRFIAAVEAAEIAVGEYLRQLNRPVRAEIEEHDRIAGFDESDRRTVRLHDDRRHDEFVEHRTLVRFRDRSHRIFILRTVAVYHRTVRLLCPLPALVTVHRIIAALYGRDAADAELGDFGKQLLHVLCGAVRGYVAAVQKRMNVHIVQLLFLAGFEQSEQVCDMAMHAAVGEQAVKMQLLAVLLGVTNRARIVSLS